MLFVLSSITSATANTIIVQMFEAVIVVVVVGNIYTLVVIS